MRDLYLPDDFVGATMVRGKGLTHLLLDVAPTGVAQTFCNRRIDDCEILTLDVYLTYFSTEDVCRHCVRRYMEGWRTPHE